MRLGEFQLTELLGRGGTGEVWKAWDERLARFVAVKISTVVEPSPLGRERFEREALATARLAHPNIVPVFQTGTEGGRSYLVMPYIDGTTLDRLTLSVREALQLMHTVALAVAHAHGQGIVHRDLKPANVMVAR